MLLSSVLIGLFVGLLVALLVYFWLNSKLQNSRQDNTKLQAQISINEKEIELITQSSEDLKNNFKQIAGDILKQEEHHLKNKNTELLTPLQKEITEFKKRIEAIATQQVQDGATLKEQIKQLSDANQNTIASAEKLTNALTYDNKQQGDWGEMKLESILQGSGLQKDIEYEVQKVFRDDRGKSFKPDVIVHLPDGKDIVIDSKVSLSAYQNYIENPSDSQALTKHIQSVEKHINDISLKSYENLIGVNTLDFIFVFFPIEASLLVAIEKKSELFANAMRKNIALVSPSTLIMSLKTVHHIWQTEKQNKNTEQIVRQAGAMYDKLHGFITSLDDINQHLEKASNSYQTARSRLSEGKGNIFITAKKIKELGVGTKKQLKQ